MIPPLLGIGVVLAAFAGLLALLAVLRRVAAAPPELTRKVLHVGMGLAVLPLPRLFGEAWPGLVLCGSSVLVLLALRVVRPLRDTVGRVVNGVPRASVGDLCFPLGLCTVWLLYWYAPEADAGRRLGGHVVPVLILAVADAAAAVVGGRYGRWKYATAGGGKTVEGSAAFFLASVGCVCIPLLLLADRGPVDVLLVAVLVAALATAVEALAWGGLDNLLLPPAAYVLLAAHIDLPTGALLGHLGAVAALTAAAVAVRRPLRLGGSAVVAVVLIGYTCWRLGWWAWTGHGPPSA